MEQYKSTQRKASEGLGRVINKMPKKLTKEEYMEHMEEFCYTNPKESYKYAKSIYDEYVNTEDKVICAISLYYMAKSKRTLFETASAEALILKGLRIVSDIDIRIHMLLEYTAILLECKNYQLAYDCLYSAYEESFKIPSQLDILIKIFNAFGVMYGEVGDYKKALTSFKQCLQYLSEEDTFHYAIVHLNIGECYYNLKEIELAKHYMEQAENLLTEQEFMLASSYCVRLKTELLVTEGKLEEALDNIHKGIRISKSDETTFYMELLLIQGDIYSKQDRLKDAMKSYEMALEIAERKSHDDVRERALKGLIQFHEEMQNEKELLHYLKAYYDYQDKKNSLGEVNLRNSMRSADEKFETRKKLLRLQQQNDMLHRMNQSVKHIHDLCKTLLMQDEMARVFTELHHNILNLTQADVFGIALLNEERDEILVNSFNLDKRLATKGVVPFDEEQNLISRVINSKQYLYINDLTKYKGPYKVLDSEKGTIVETSTVRSSIYIPLLDESEAFGVLTMQSSREDAYSQEDIDLLEILASFASVAIKNLIKSEQLNELTTKDPLTNLYNRRALQKHIATFEGERVSILFIDIDYFKEYNDHYGHLKGDDCIKEVADIITSALEPDDFAARYGGDEFIILLDNSEPEYLVQCANAIRNKIWEANIEHSNSDIADYVSLSIGAANKTRCQSSCVDDILHIADQALYEAKTKGRNCVAFNFGE